MIVEYHRPDNIADVLNLISRQEPVTYPMGGGSVLNRPCREGYAVVDLQALGLDQIKRGGSHLMVGATTKLCTLAEYGEIQPALGRVIQREGSSNLRHFASIAGTILTGGGRSGVVGALLALDATLDVESLVAGTEHIKLGDLLAMPDGWLNGKLIIAIHLPIHVRLSYEYASRTPADLPLVFACIAQWASGRTRLVLGGYGKSPRLVLDGPDASGIEDAARDAYSQAEDQWASASYRQKVAGVLALRCMADLQNQSLAEI